MTPSALQSLSVSRKIQVAAFLLVAAIGLAAVDDNSRAPAVASEACQVEECNTEVGDDNTKLLLLQGNIALSRAGHIATESTCADLKDQSTFSTVPIKVGTPGQEFEVVPDTGSNAVLVPSCGCVKSGSCKKMDGCFAYENGKSTTAMLTSLPALIFAYGSGTITTTVLSDYLEVADVRVYMKDEIFLMENLNLDFDSSFQGILGLGPPMEQGIPNETFIERANLERFTVCFNTYPTSGALRLGVPEFSKPLPSIGTYHWGLDYRGISVGNSSAPVKFCTPDEMSEVQLTACGAIPDTGSTLMSGPADQLELLFSDICDNWPRCANVVSQDATDELKSITFQLLLQDCNTWLNEGEGIDELPSIFLHVAGADGTVNELEISPSAYVSEMDITMLYYIRLKLGRLVANVPVKVVHLTFCAPNFGVIDYNTLLNGPVWILGTPLFFEYTVGFDVSSNAINFQAGTCSSCSDSLSLLSSNSTASSKGPRRLRRLEGSIRSSNVDVKQPL